MDGFTIKNSAGSLDTGLLRVNQNSQSRLTSGESDSLSGAGAAQGGSFADTLKKAIDEVNTLQQVANKKAEDLSVGKTDNVAEVMIATEKADIALRVMVQVRNKIIDAYNEIMRMQV
ncbi:MAG: flagellar hook-basal body complex protein FliE [Bdellovibrionales bacterium]